MQHNSVNSIREQFISKYKNSFVYPDHNIEKDGNLEILGASFIADEPTIFGRPTSACW